MEWPWRLARGIVSWGFGISLNYFVSFLQKICFATSTTTIRTSLHTYPSLSNTITLSYIALFLFFFRSLKSSLGWWTYFFVRLVLPILFVVLSLSLSFFFLSLLYSCWCCSFLNSGETRLSNTHTYIRTYTNVISQISLSFYVSLIRYGSFLACILSSFFRMLFLLVISHFLFHNLSIVVYVWMNVCACFFSLSCHYGWRSCEPSSHTSHLILLLLLLLLCVCVCVFSERTQLF